ncbi:YicC/YloC family endoribonuclease [Siminovitchia sp. FSL H7-0308]|uniref:YicC/YloC family endoribonuclease n=1 Tax=Siminovitchia sp. FSL H7-0308 TaxID=2921432 RepID=UPI0030EED76F
MAASMTGFGRSIKQTENLSIQVEIKTVNHRFLEYSIKLPQAFAYADMEIRKCLNKYIKRGRVEVHATFSGTWNAAKELHIDWNLLDSYYQFIQQASERYQLPSDLSVTDVLHIDEAVVVSEGRRDVDDLVTVLMEAVEEAADKLLEMRIREGENLLSDLANHISSLHLLVEKAKMQAPKAEMAYREKLEKKLKDVAGDMLDDTRIATEAAVFADKSDISEELARLASHIAQFTETMNSKGPVGRKLDFIIQEMNREANTIGSKGSDSDISSLVVEMKVLIEKLREQVQNLE